jgi:ribosomal protein S18 acetylase RimI-like enzyme
MKLSLRSVTNADKDYARGVRHTAYRDVVIRQFGMFSEPDQDRFFEHAWGLADHEIILVDEEPCGFVAIVDERDHIRLLELCVEPRSQNRGIGSFILSETIRRADARSLPVRLRVLHENRAIKLYNRFDFVEIERNATHVEMIRRGSRPE